MKLINAYLKICKTYFAVHFRSLPFFAAEYTKSGIGLTKILAKAENLSIDVGHSDFTSADITTLRIPDNSIIFTSYATHYVPKLRSSFVKGLCKFNPKVIIHFEPCYEHFDTKTILGLMRKRYIEVNDYNTNLATLLHFHHQAGKIKILYEKPTFFGGNPLLAASVLAWRPLYNSEKKVKKN